MNRAQPVLAFAAILATCIAGIWHMSPWTVVAGVSILALCSLSNVTAVVQRNGQAARLTSAPALLGAIVLNASAAACAAYILGRLIGWCWGL